MVMSRVYFFFLCFFIAFSVTSGGKGLALIVNGKLFHYEVASFFADHLRVLDYSIQIWLTQNNAKNPMMAKAGYEFLQDYAKDIRFLPDHSQAMTKAMELPRERIKLLVHINADENTDFRQLCQLNLHDSLMQKAEKVIMVVHYAGNAVRVSRLCKSPRCALFVLGEHIQQAAMRYIRMVGLDTEVLSAYGVYKLAAKYNSNTMAYKEQLVRRRGTSSSSKSAIISRKNTTAKTAPIKTTVPLLDPDRHTKMPRRLATLPATSPSSSASPYRFIVIQGTFYVQRRRYADLFACVHKLIVQGHTNLRLVLLGKTVSGRKLHIPSNIQNHTIIQSDKAYTEFYSTLLASDILVSFANEGFSYMVNRSTSSVTMGVICEVPLALPLKMLNKYPCIRDQHWHKNITAHDDCSTLTAAVKLSDQQLLVMRQEVKHCKEVWLDEGRRVLEEFVQRPVVSSGGNSTERYVRQCWDLVMKSTVS